MAEVHERLADHTTLRLGGPAAEFLVARDEAALIHGVQQADDLGTPVLVLGGGSNLVVSDAGFAGRVVQVATSGVQVAEDPCSGATVTVAAGEDWDTFVAAAIGGGWVGVEALSGIPGRVGAAPMQNIGAYGQEVAQTIASVRCWDRNDSQIRTFPAAECDFGYRSSRFKQQRDRYVVLSVTFQLRLGDLGAPVVYDELARSLEVEPGGRAPLGTVRDAVLALRSGKGMVLDDQDHDTWSAGSFFTNPVLEPVAVPDGAPTWLQPDGRVKTSAAWLIERAGFGKGYGPAHVQLSGKHTLALTNRGAATTDELMALAREVRDGVRRTFGIDLVNEPVLVGCTL